MRSKSEDSRNFPHANYYHTTLKNDLGITLTQFKFLHLNTLRNNINPEERK